MSDVRLLTVFLRKYWYKPKDGHAVQYSIAINCKSVIAYCYKNFGMYLTQIILVNRSK